MNSSQRRRDNRRWCYNVKYDRYISKEEYDVMWDWCVSQFGNKLSDGWRERHGHIGTWWQFSKKEVYTLFVMRWGM